MLEIFLEIIFYVFGKESYNKVKKWLTRNISKNKETSKKLQKAKEKNIVSGQTIVSCTGCKQILKEPPVYEQGQPWCHKCYKTQVLKLR